MACWWAFGMAGLQCQFTGAWRGGFLHCWPAQAELCLPELQESFSSAILLENLAQAEEKGKKKKKIKFVQICPAEVPCPYQAMPSMGSDGLLANVPRSTWDFWGCVSHGCLYWPRVLLTARISGILTISHVGAMAPVLWASRRVHRHLVVIKDGLQGNNIGFPACLWCTEEWVAWAPNGTMTTVTTSSLPSLTSALFT